MNAISFLPMNIDGDDRNVFPYLDYNERLRMDVSRLGQWEIIFEHATQQGVFLHFKTQETENELLLDDGNLGLERKLYYRELIARFAHHLALNWNLGEETNDASTQQKQSWARYFWEQDPYQHHIVIHNGGDNHYDLLGPANGRLGSEVTGFSLQTNNSRFVNVHDRVKEYRRRSAEAGKPWAVAVDEPGDAQHAIRPDNDAGDSHEDGRKNALWGGLTAGAWGLEYYFGYAHAHSDLTLNDFRSRDAWWDYPRYALEFFADNQIPFWEMENANQITSTSNDFAFIKPNEVYVVYLKEGGTTRIDLNTVSGAFEVAWFDPRNGGPLQNGSTTRVQGGRNVSLGTAPQSPDQDWVVLLQRPRGDFDHDGIVNAADIDLLLAATNSPMLHPDFDLNSDDRVDRLDVTEMVEVLLRTRRGDTNLDGKVDFSDFLTLSANFGQPDKIWSQGNFNGDREVSFADFLTLSAEFGFGTDD